MHNTSIETERWASYILSYLYHRKENGEREDKKTKNKKFRKKTICEAKKGNKKHKINISLKYLENFYIKKKFSLENSFPSCKTS